MVFHSPKHCNIVVENWSYKYLHSTHNFPLNLLFLLFNESFNFGIILSVCLSRLIICKLTHILYVIVTIIAPESIGFKLLIHSFAFLHFEKNSSSCIKTRFMSFCYAWRLIKRGILALSKHLNQ
jgi:hypothetical protein